jgi:hypothetical protein
MIVCQLLVLPICLPKETAFPARIDPELDLPGLRTPGMPPRTNTDTPMYPSVKYSAQYLEHLPY